MFSLEFLASERKQDLGVVMFKAVVLSALMGAGVSAWECANNTIHAKSVKVCVLGLDIVTHSVAEEHRDPGAPPSSSSPGKSHPFLHDVASHRGTPGPLGRVTPLLFLT